LFLSNILKILYAPQKAIKEVTQNPRYIGPLLVLILFIAVEVGFVYFPLTRSHYELTLPQTYPAGANVDTWTQSTSYWSSPNANITTSSDAITGLIYGNASIAFSAQNNPEVSMQLSSIGSINCSSPDQYNLLSFRTKQTSPTSDPNNVTIQILSLNSTSDYFYNDLTDVFSNATLNTWNNITLELNASTWIPQGKPDWTNITGLQLQFTYTTNSNVTMLIDGLFFHGPYKTMLEIQGTGYLGDYAVVFFFQYAIQWIALTGLLYVLVKAFKGNIVWKPALIAVGFILMTMVIGGIINMLGAYYTFPPTYYPFSYLAGVPGEGTATTNLISTQQSAFSYISLVSDLVVLVWTIALTSLLVRILAGFSWVKSIAIAIIAYLISYFVSLIFG
jgi:hypothetical protein